MLERVSLFQPTNHLFSLSLHNPTRDKTFGSCTNSFINMSREFVKKNTLQSEIVWNEDIYKFA